MRKSIGQRQCETVPVIPDTPLVWDATDIRIDPHFCIETAERILITTPVLTVDPAIGNGSIEPLVWMKVISANKRVVHVVIIFEIYESRAGIVF